MKKTIKKESESVKRELDTLVLVSHDAPRQKLRDVIFSEVIKGFRIGRKCIGSKLEWVGQERVEVPTYKETRFVIDFEGGLSLNVSKSVFLHVKNNRKVEYFSFYD